MLPPIVVLMLHSAVRAQSDGLILVPSEQQLVLPNTHPMLWCSALVKFEGKQGQSSVEERAASHLCF